jgi:hypothetical protein
MVHRDQEIQPPYNKEFAGILSFSSFAAAEETIKRLENLRLKYLSASDKRGVEYCRQTALLGRRRAEMIGRNRRVSHQKRLQKKEIAIWFAIWLETPFLFENWLTMRKKTPEFKKLMQSEFPDRTNSGGRRES